MKTLRNSLFLIALLALAGIVWSRSGLFAGPMRAEASPASGLIQAGEAVAPAGTPLQLELLAVLPALTVDQQAAYEATLARGPRQSPPLPVGTTAVQRADSSLDPHTATNPASIQPAKPLAPDASGDFLLYRHTDLSGALKPWTAATAEPSVANSGPVVFMAGNWFAAISVDGGRNFSFVNPYTMFPASAGGFCCHQVVLYDAGRDLFIWYLQYLSSGAAGSGQNLFRIAVARPAQAAQGSWNYWDFTSAANTEWDYPDLCLSNDYVWITTNRGPFDSPTVNDAWIFKLPLEGLATGGTFGYGYVDLGAHSLANVSLRCTRGARETMYFGSHNSTSQLRIFRWAENGGSLMWNDVNLSAAWNNAVHVCPGPDSRDWCGADDGRIQTAWVARGRIGFLWGASQGGSFPYPYVEAVRVNEADRAYVDRPFLWGTSGAFAYPAAHPNGRGDLGVAVFFGGGGSYPTLGVLIDDDFSRDAGSVPPPWEFHSVRQSSQGPNFNHWGDYISVLPFAPTGLGWIASAYTLQGCGSTGCSEPSYTIFGRERDLRSVELYFDPRYAILLPVTRK